MINQILLANYEKSRNYYQQLTVIKKIGKMLMYNKDE